MGKLIDLTGSKYGKLTVLRKTNPNAHGQLKWLCLCDCGNTIEALGHHLRNNHTTSCGCDRREKSKRTRQSNRNHGGSEAWLCPNSAIHSFANAIVLQAVTDYRKAVGSNNQIIISECEKFFLSDWFSLLTEVNGKVLLEKLQKERKEDR